MRIRIQVGEESHQAISGQNHVSSDCTVHNPGQRHAKIACPPSLHPFILPYLTLVPRPPSHHISHCCPSWCTGTRMALYCIVTASWWPRCPAPFLGHPPCEGPEVLASIVVVFWHTLHALFVLGQNLTVYPSTLRSHNKLLKHGIPQL